MNWITTRLRVTFGLSCLLLSVLLLSMLIGVLPDREKALLEGRRSLCEAIAIDCSIMASQQDMARLQAVLKALAERDPNILSAGLRRGDGELLAETGDHRSQWISIADQRSSDSQVQVPISANGKRWGNVELRFRPIAEPGLMGYFFGPLGRLLWFVCGSCFVFFFYYMKKMLEYLDPSQAVPGHVRSALDTLAEGLLVIDSRDRIVLANGAFAALLGISAEKLLGRAASRLPWIRENENEPASELPWTLAIREKAPKTNIMLRLQTAAGGRRTFIVNSSPVLGSKGEYRGVLASFDDVTDLEEKEFALRKAVASADAANRTKSEFLANMSHEIRTPMNAILGFTDVLRRGFAADESTRLHYLDTIHSSGKHLLDLINDILDLSKIEAGRLEIERKPCSPCELILEVVAMFTVPAQNRGIFLEFATNGPVPETISTDPTRLRQVIANLVGNAIKFTETGGVKIVVRLVANTSDATARLTGEFAASAERPQLAIDIIDSGIGISPEGLGKIFEPFMQADNTVTRRFGGTGLGLTISRRFATALGGDLIVASEPGQGSTFTVKIDTGPLDGIRLLDASQAKVAAARSLDSATAKLPPLPPARVLVVDDGEANRQLIKVVLTRAGLKVEGAENGEVAVRMATEQRFDLILMDMQMPVMDGYTATATLRERGLTIPIVALTASVMKGSEGRCGAVGCTAYISKPVDIDQLMRCLAELLQGTAPAAPEASQDIANLSLAEVPQTDGESGQDAAEFVRFVKEQLNAMHFALQQRQFNTLIELARLIKQTAGEAGQAEFQSIAMNLEELSGRNAADEIEEAICDLAILSETMALKSLMSEQQVAVSAQEAPVVHKAPTATPSLKLPNSTRHRPPLVSSLPMDDADFREIVVGFIPRLHEKAADMRSAWERRDFEELAGLAHWLKGAGGTVGFDALTGPAAELESLAKQQRADAFGPALDEVLEMIGSIAVPPEPAFCQASY